MSHHPIWETASLWIGTDGNIWHSLRGNPNHRDLNMSVMSPREADRFVAWCQMMRIPLEDKRQRVAA